MSSGILSNSSTLHDILKSIYNDKGYVFSTKPNYINNLAVRSLKDDGSDINLYNDVLYCIWIDKTGTKNVLTFDEFTTDPGTPYFTNRIIGKNKQGKPACAILVEGQYKYGLGSHRGYLAGVQAGPVKVYRDHNRDRKLDLDPNTIMSGRFGINIHKGSPDEDDAIWWSSAGCQVFRYEEDFNRWLDLMKAHRRKYKTFYYTLIRDKIR